MPGLLRRLIIFAAADGLILQPYGNGSRNNGNAESWSIRIDYKTDRICPLSPSDPSTRRESGLEVYGLVGMFFLPLHAYRDGHTGASMANSLGVFTEQASSQSLPTPSLLPSPSANRSLRYRESPSTPSRTSRLSPSPRRKMPIKLYPRHGPIWPRTKVQ